MINPYNPAPLPRLNTQPTPTMGDHFARMMQPILQMQQMNQQRQMNEQAMQMNQQRMRAMDMEMSRAQRKDEREMKLEQLDQEMGEFFKAEMEAGRPVRPRDIYGFAVSRGFPTDVVRDLQKDMTKDFNEHLSIFKQMPSLQGAETLAYEARAIYGHDIDPQEIHRAFTEKSEFIKTSDGMLVPVTINNKGDVTLGNAVDLMSEEGRKMVERTESLKLRRLEASVKQAEQSLYKTSLQIQQLLNPPQGSSGINFKEVRDEVRNYEAELDKLMRQFDTEITSVMNEERKNELRAERDRAVGSMRRNIIALINNSDAPQEFKNVWLASANEAPRLTPDDQARADKMRRFSQGGIPDPADGAPTAPTKFDVFDAPPLTDYMSVSRNEDFDKRVEEIKRAKEERKRMMLWDDSNWGIDTRRGQP